MLEGPLGGAAFNNEFGRPNLAGYFRTFEQRVRATDGDAWEVRGYHKPIMLAGGLGSIRPAHVKKDSIPDGAKLAVLGGPALSIGLGGGAASSMTSGASRAALDFASVQRGNPEMERRCQEVIERCIALGEHNPILSIHDVGAGGLANALPELVHASERGARLNLRAIPSDEPGLSPLALWCNEAQERYVLAVAPERARELAALAARERCPLAFLGEARTRAQLTLHDSHFKDAPVDVPLALLFGNTPRMERRAKRTRGGTAALALKGVTLEDAARRVLRLPSVGDKTFLIHIGDRSVGGLTARDQMVGPWQVPVADAALTCAGFTGFAGEAFALGERAPLALLDAPASARMAIGEALTNLLSAAPLALSEVRLSANWMAAAGHPGEDAALFDAVRAAGVELCPALGLAIPVGKDSLSMRTTWKADGGDGDGDGGGDAQNFSSVTAPLTLVATACAPVADVRRALTPELAVPSRLRPLHSRNNPPRCSPQLKCFITNDIVGAIHASDGMMPVFTARASTRNAA